MEGKNNTKKERKNPAKGAEKNKVSDDATFPDDKPSADSAADSATETTAKSTADSAADPTADPAAKLAAKHVTQTHDQKQWSWIAILAVVVAGIVVIASLYTIHQNALESLQVNLKKYETKVTSLEDLIRKEELAKVAEKKEKVTLEENLLASQAEVTTLTTAANQFNIDLKEARETIENLKVSLSTSAKDHDEMTRNLKATNDELKEVSDNLTEKHRTLGASLNTCNKEKTDLEGVIEVNKGDIESLKSQLSSQQSTNAMLVKAKDEQKTEFEAKDAAHVAKLAKTNGELKTIKNTLATIKAEKIQFDGQITGLQENLTQCLNNQEILEKQSIDNNATCTEEKDFLIKTVAAGVKMTNSCKDSLIEANEKHEEAIKKHEGAVKDHEEANKKHEGAVKDHEEAVKKHLAAHLQLNGEITQCKTTSQECARDLAAEQVKNEGAKEQLSFYQVQSEMYGLNQLNLDPKEHLNQGVLVGVLFFVVCVQYSWCKAEKQPSHPAMFLVCAFIVILAQLLFHGIATSQSVIGITAIFALSLLLQWSVERELDISEKEAAKKEEK